MRGGSKLSRPGRKLARDTTNYLSSDLSVHTQLILPFLSKFHAARPRLTISHLPTIIDSRNCGGESNTGRWHHAAKDPLAKTIHFILLSPIAPITPFSFRLSRCLFHPHRIVGSGATESTLGKNLTHLNRYSASWMCLAVILAGFDAFLACFALHSGVTSFSAQFA